MVTALDSSVLIGSELAMADSQTDISEFEGRTREWLISFFSTNPIDHVVLLNVHEYIHTQQKPQVHSLLSIAIREGVAEFVPSLAMDVPPVTPAIAFGKNSADAVRETFEIEMFYPNNQPKWFWSNYPKKIVVLSCKIYNCNAS